MDSERFLSPREVADKLGLHVNTVYRAIDSGELRAHKLRGALRIAPASLDAWLEATL